MSERPATAPVVRVAALAFALALVAVAALFALPDGTEALRECDWWLAVLIGAGFVAAERAVFHLELRREAISFSLSEVPSLFALVFLDVRLAIAIRVVTGFVSTARRRPPAYKLIFNAALFAFEASVGALVFRWLLRSTDGSETWLLVFGVVTVGVLTVAGSVMVTAAIAQFEGGFLDKAAGELSSTAWVYMLNATIAGMVLSPALRTPWLSPFALAPAGMFWMFMRQQSRTRQALHDVEALHGFAGLIAGEIDLYGIARRAVDESVGLLRAGHATLIVLDGGDIVMTVSSGTPVALLTDQRDRWHDALIASPLGEQWPDDSNLGRVCIATVRSEQALVAVLGVEGREGATETFSDTDLERLRTIADQLAAPIARGLLHRQLEIEARHDPLTGLINRTAFERELETTRRQDRPDASIAFVAMFDLDRFKEVNDTLGHHAGDQLLIEIARRLTDETEPGDVLARLAGDEFALAGNRDTIDDIDAYVRRCTTAIARPIQLDDLELVVNASVGIAADIEQPDHATMLRRADIAMYHAKQNRLGHEFYRRDIDRRTPARLSMLADLRTVIECGDIELHLQPKVDIVTDVVAGAEVLARWRHPTRGLVPPSDFIAVAEQSGLIRALTDLVLDGTVKTIASLDGLGYSLGLAMNLSAQDLVDELLGDRVQRRIDQYGVDPSRLTLEITEGTLLYDSPRTKATIDRLHDIGVNLSIDDFGTGYSSLSYLRRLPVSELKIDRSFITNLVVDAQDETIVKSIIDLGHNLGLQVVAEGVETSEVGDRLRVLGCDIAQGFGICRPVPFDQFTSWLTNTTYTTRRHDPVDPRAW